MTLLEYYNTQETLLPQELIYGCMRMADAPFVSHQRIVLKLAIALQEHAETTGAGEVFLAPIDVVLNEKRALVVQPDLLFISQGRIDIVHDRIYGAPDLVVEVLSPRPRIGMLEERVGWFAEHGVPEIWLYNQPDRRLDILSCDRGVVVSRRSIEYRDRVQSAVLPRFDGTMDSILGMP